MAQQEKSFRREAKMPMHRISTKTLTFSLVAAAITAVASFLAGLNILVGLFFLSALPLMFGLALYVLSPLIAAIVAGVSLKTAYVTFLIFFALFKIIIEPTITAILLLIIPVHWNIFMISGFIALVVFIISLILYVVIAEYIYRKLD